MSNKICPVCGTNSLESRKETQILKEAYGGQQKVDMTFYHCMACDSEGDFFNENEDKINASIENLKSKAIDNILTDFNNNKISMSAIERALSLPQRTLTKWKNRANNPSASGLALLKYLRTFPWLIEVAEQNFDYNIAQKIHINSAIQKFLNSINFKDTEFLEAGIIETSKSMFLYMQLSHSNMSNESGFRIVSDSNNDVSTANN